MGKVQRFSVVRQALCSLGDNWESGKMVERRSITSPTSGYLSLEMAFHRVAKPS
jgi:hypothetical protein